MQVRILLKPLKKDFFGVFPFSHGLQFSYIWVKLCPNDTLQNGACCCEKWLEGTSCGGAIIISRKEKCGSHRGDPKLFFPRADKNHLLLLLRSDIYCGNSALRNQPWEKGASNTPFTRDIRAEHFDHHYSHWTITIGGERRWNHNHTNSKKSLFMWIQRDSKRL